MRCGVSRNSDSVVRYDQLANRWLIVVPVFTRPPDNPKGPYAMCYAVSATSDPLGAYYRYEFQRPLFPDYPRPAVWPDGYYNPTSTSDDLLPDVITQKHVCIADRNKMLQGLPATEQCVVIDGGVFMLNADVDGTRPPPTGAPNIMMSTGGTQLMKIFEDDGIYFYKVHVDWSDATKTTVSAPQKIAVAPYHYLCDGQLSSCVSQPGTERRLDSQGDKLIQRLVYRNLGGHESILAEHSVRAPPRTAAACAGMSSASTNSATPCCTSRAPTPPADSTAGWEAWPWTAKAISASAIPSAAIPTIPASASPRAWPRPQGPAYFPRVGAGRRPSLANRQPALGGFHQHSRRPVRRLHFLVCGELPQKRQHHLNHPHRLISGPRL